MPRLSNTGSVINPPPPAIASTNPASNPVTNSTANPQAGIAEIEAIFMNAKTQSPHASLVKRYNVIPYTFSVRSTYCWVGMARCAVPVAERSVRRRNRTCKREPNHFHSARYDAGGDIAARCPYLQL